MEAKEGGAGNPRETVQRVSRWLGAEDIEKEFAFCTGRILTGLNFSSRAEGWLLVVKCRTKVGAKEVAFLGGVSPIDCLEAFLMMLNSREGLRWKPDLY